MNYLDKHVQKQWGELHSIDRYRPLYPSEAVVRFVLKYYGTNRTARILDVGCGAGRDVFMLASEGFDTSGCDVSREGIDYTRQRLVESHLSAELHVAPVVRMPFSDNSFDCVLCSNVLTYLPNQDLLAAVQEINRVLVSGGYAQVILRSVDDFRFKRGVECDHNTYIISESHGNPHMEGLEGIRMHFFSREEIMSMFKIFSKIEVDELTETYGNGKFVDVSFRIAIRKG